MRDSLLKMQSKLAFSLSLSLSLFSMDVSVTVDNRQMVSKESFGTYDRLQLIDPSIVSLSKLVGSELMKEPAYKRYRPFCSVNASRTPCKYYLARMTL